MGFKADIVLWDYEKREIIHQMRLHKVKVQDLGFSKDEKFLCSIGGEDDNNVTIWDIQTGKPICGLQDTKSNICCGFFNKRSDTIIVGGKYTLKLFHIDFKNRKLDPVQCNLGILKREIVCVILDENDDYAFCGTTSGEVFCVQMKVCFLSFFIQFLQNKKISKIVSIRTHKSSNSVVRRRKYPKEF